MRSSGYRALFRVRVVRWQAGAGLLAQVTQGAAGAGIILVIRQHGGSLDLAGVVVAALWIAAGVARPIQGRLIDRRGPAGVLAGCGVVHGAALAGIVGLSSLHASGVWLVALAIVGGLALPPVSTTMRLAWGEVVSEREHTAAYSLVYLVQELAVLTGPLILAALIGVFSAPVALITVAALAAAGSVGFAASLHGHLDHLRRAAGPSAPALRLGIMKLLVAVAILTGAVVGGIQVAAPTFATQHHAPAAAGLLIAALSVGGILGAATYASGRWRLPPAARLLPLLASLTVLLGLVSAAHTLVLVGGLLIFAGLPLNPAISTLSLIVDEHVPRRAAAEAFGWLSMGIAVGSGAGSVLAATFAQHQHDAGAAFVVAACAALAATALTVAGRRSLRSSVT